MTNRISIIVEKIIDDIEEEVYNRCEEQVLEKAIFHGHEIDIMPDPEEVFNKVAEDMVDKLYIRLVNRNFFNDFYD